MNARQLLKAYCCSRIEAAWSFTLHRKADSSRDDDDDDDDVDNINADSNDSDEYDYEGVRNFFVLNLKPQVFLIGSQDDDLTDITQRQTRGFCIKASRDSNICQLCV